MGPEKAPSTDDLLGIFFQIFLDIMGREVTRVVLRVINEGASLGDRNYMIITIIPKAKELLLVKDFRLISLTNIYYKIIVRALTDNILIGFECMHWIKNYRNSKRGYTTLNLDRVRHTTGLNGTSLRLL